jgi:Transposase, Mutator family
VPHPPAQVSTPTPCRPAGTWSSTVGHIHDRSPVLVPAELRADWIEVLDALKVADVGDRVRQAAETIYQALIEAELTDAIGAAPHERSAERINQRNGHRTRNLTTTAGDLELRIPKPRTGSFFPAPLERRRRVRHCRTVRSGRSRSARPGKISTR